MLCYEGYKCAKDGCHTASKGSMGNTPYCSEALGFGVQGLGWGLWLGSTAPTRLRHTETAAMCG